MNLGNSQTPLGGTSSSLSTLWITRVSKFRDVFSRYRVMIDGAEYASIGPGQTVEIRLAPGQYRVVAAVDWCRSNPVLLDTQSGGCYRMEVGSNIIGWRVLWGVAYVTIWRDRYLYLQNA
jgi:hypothetical protein